MLKHLASRPSRDIRYGFACDIAPDANLDDVQAAMDSFVLAAYTETGKCFIRIPVSFMFVQCGGGVDYESLGAVPRMALRFAIEARGPEADGDTMYNPHCRMPWYTVKPFTLRIIGSPTGEILAGWRFEGDSIASLVETQTAPRESTGEPNAPTSEVRS